jgi:hypothetical protein
MDYYHTIGKIINYKTQITLTTEKKVQEKISPSDSNEEPSPPAKHLLFCEHSI